MKKLNKTQLLPLCLLLYLGFMAYVGFPHYKAGDHLYYFGVIGGGLTIIALLYIVLRKREKIRNERDEKLRDTYTYGKYDETDNSENKNEVKD